MTAAIIWSAVLLVLAVFIFSRIYIGVSFDETGLFIKMSYLFLNMSLVDTIQDKVKKTVPLKKKKKEKPEEKKEHGAVNINAIIPLAKKALKKVFAFIKKIRIDHLGADLVIASDDAAKTAELFGKTAASLAVALPLIENVFIVRERNIRVNADYSSVKTSARVYLSISLRVSSIFSLLGGMIKLAVPALLKGDLFKKSEDNSQENKKAA